MTKDAKLYIFTAPSGAGKTSIVKEILKIFPDFKFSISATTRKKRENEIDGKDYFFISEKDFMEKVRNNEFLEWEKFYGYYYGTLKSYIDENLSQGNSMVLDIDVKGAINILKLYPDSISFFIMPPSLEELKDRLINRNTETEEDLKKRIERAEMELTFADKFKHKIINIDLRRAIEEVKEIINKEIDGGHYGNSTN